jgi:hypothetical protein
LPVLRPEQKEEVDAEHDPDPAEDDAEGAEPGEEPGAEHEQSREEDEHLENAIALEVVRVVRVVIVRRGDRSILPAAPAALKTVLGLFTP